MPCLCRVAVCRHPYLPYPITLQFVFQHNNLVVWGPPGTGKTCLSKMIATSACAKGLRTRWVTFPVLYDQLLRLYRSTDGQTLDSKLAYYSRFDLLCIDEFPNVSDIDPFLVQQMFNTFSEKATSLLVCMQVLPEKMDELVSHQGHRPVRQGQDTPESQTQADPSPRSGFAASKLRLTEFCG